MIRSMLVSEWMSPAETVEPDTPFRRALAKMELTGAHCLTVVDNGHVVGILTLGDIRHAMPADRTTRRIWDVNQTWEKVTTAHIMSSVVITIEPQASMARAAQMMLDHKISRLPVVDERGLLVGILTHEDIYRMLVDSRKPETGMTEPEVAFSA